jgi:hypothetical protein
VLSSRNTRRISEFMVAEVTIVWRNYILTCFTMKYARHVARMKAVRNAHINLARGIKSKSPALKWRDSVKKCRKELGFEVMDCGKLVRGWGQ